jgi:hypothetical protein
LFVETRPFEHVDGPEHGTGALARLPSQSLSWRSIANVIVSRDNDTFEQGTPNTDWRLAQAAGGNRMNGRDNLKVGTAVHVTLTRSRRSARGVEP